MKNQKKNRKKARDKRKEIKAPTAQTEERSSSLKSLAVFLAILAVILTGVVIYVIKSKNNNDSAPVTSASAPETKIDFAVNEAIRLKDRSISMEEFLLYSVPAVDEHRKVYTDSWSEVIALDNGNKMTYEEYVKCDIIDTAILTKSLSAKFDADGHALTETEEQEILKSAEEYLEILNANGLGDDDLDLVTVYGFMSENYRAQKEYTIMFGEEASIDDEEVIKRLGELMAEYRGEDFDAMKNVNWDLINQVVFDPDVELVEMDNLTPATADSGEGTE